jgi:hypothetical protein
MDMIIYDVYNVCIITMDSQMIEDTVVKCKILRDDGPGLREHTGIWVTGLSRKKIEKIMMI